MASFTSLYSSMSDTPMISVPAYSSSSSSLGAGVDDAFEDDACSICLDPFTPQEPATVTEKQRVPDMLAASCPERPCQTERCFRPRNSNPSSMIIHHLDEDYDIEQDSHSDDSDFDEHVLQHLSASAASRARYACKRERHRSTGLGPSQVLVFTSPEHVHTAQQTYTLPEEGQILSYGSSVINSSTPATPSVNIQNLSSVAPPVVNQVSTTAVNSPSKPRILFRQPPTVPPQGQGSSDVFSLSDSFKSKWFAASTRYKESLSKGTRGMKEKLLARNNSVKELSKEVQREMSAGIAGVARMIERLDLTSKRTGPAMSDSDFTGGITNFSWKGKGVEQNIIAQALTRKSEKIAHDTSLGASSRASATVPAQVEITHM
ncbi:hypothetical protein SADUNF_Sadunf08G0121100 [Salix dunnii]|uniref:E3 ubiquitin-protein ligase RHF1A n=1 Tax=Salix dunnii TaxID=1413687 RepID=A0A835K0L9_9ROSI|nr:hypothetical protein SADUNF_Sadunf08G0121100 [Salix dunnii]